MGSTRLKSRVVLDMFFFSRDFKSKSGLNGLNWPYTGRAIEKTQNPAAY